mgnify:CR=1 FL=1
MSIITVYLGNERQQDEDWLIRFLQILFKDTEISPAVKKQLLKNEFDMDISADIEEEMRTMCNLSTGIYEQGMERGMERDRLESLRTIMQTMRLSEDEAMNALLIPPEKRAKYKELLAQ